MNPVYNEEIYNEEIKSYDLHTIYLMLIARICKNLVRINKISKDLIAKIL